MTSDFVTYHAAKPEPVEEIETEKPKPTYIEGLVGKAVTAIYKGHGQPWTEAKKQILFDIDSLRCGLGASGYPMLKADVEEIETTIRFCQSIDDVEAALVNDSLALVLKKYKSGRYEGAR